jgi:DNA-binding MarR family transcriptional regulator
MKDSPSQSDSSSTDGSAHSAKWLRCDTDEKFIWRFSPSQTDPELLETISVGREPLLQNVLEKIHDSATSGSTQHVLLWGPSGIGKSHFLSLLFHRLNNDKQLHNAIRIARLNEEETSTSLVQFLVRVYRSLGQSYPDEFALDWLDEVLNHPPGEVAEMLTRRLVARFEKRRLVILVEHLSQFFDSLGPEGQHHLRTLLQEHPFACLIASSQNLFKAVSDRSEPFFGFFQPIPLRPLSLQDAQKLLLKIATFKGQKDLVIFLNSPAGQSRVRAIHDLTGGNHRVYVVMSRFLTRDSLHQLVAPFQRTCDDLTPIYQQRLREVSPLQRQIVELLCSESRTLNPKEIARRLLLTEQSVGKQIRNLVEIGYLTSQKKGRETYYELSEPLMRLTYELKDSVPLVEFLRIWHCLDENDQIRFDAPDNAIQAYLDAAKDQSAVQAPPRAALLSDDLELAEAQGLTIERTRSATEKAEASKAATEWFQAGSYFAEIRKDHRQALQCYAKVLQLAPDHSSAKLSRGISLFAMHRWDEGFASVSEGMVHNNDASDQLGDAASMLGLIFQLSEDYDRLQSRVNTLFDLYEQFAIDRGFRGGLIQSQRGSVDPLSYLAVGLVKCLAKIDSDRVTSVVLHGYVRAVEQRAAGRPEFAMALRLFRCGIRYLMSHNEADFVELIQPERNILRQIFSPGTNGK